MSDLNDFPASWRGAVHSYLIEKEANCAPSTLRFYTSQLAGLGRWAIERQIALADFRAAHLNQYLISRRAAGVSANTLHHDYVVARRFFAHAAENSFVNPNPLLKMKRKGPGQAHVPQPSVDEGKALFLAIQNRWDPKTSPNATYQSPKQRAFYCARDTAIVATLMDTGARAGEVLGLTMDCYKPDLQQMVFTHTKNGDSRTVPISPICIALIAAYLEVRPECDSPHLFISNLGTKLDVCAYSKVFARYVAFGGLKFTMHGIRHYTLSEIAKHDLWAAVAIAGHKNPKTTTIYAKHDPVHVREAHQKIAPLGQVMGTAPPETKPESEKEKPKRVI